jgi:hypothetical protein
MEPFLQTERDDQLDPIKFTDSESLRSCFWALHVRRHVQHPSLLAVKGWAIDISGKRFVIVAPVPHRSLVSFLRIGRALDFRRQCKIVYGIACGIDFLHSRDVACGVTAEGISVIEEKDIFAKISFFKSTSSLEDDVKMFHDVCAVVLQPLDKQRVNVAGFLQLFMTPHPMGFFVAEFKRRFQGPLGDYPQHYAALRAPRVPDLPLLMPTARHIWTTSSRFVFSCWATFPTTRGSRARRSLGTAASAQTRRCCCRSFS